MRLHMPVLVMILVASLLMPGARAQRFPSPAPLDIDGFPLALSPDGASVAGVDATGRQFCVWNLATLEPTCDGDLPAPVEARSVAWSPDNSAVAFSFGASNRLVDSDIFVFDVAEGTLHNLTDDTGADDVSFLVPPGEPVAIDVFPAWSPDGTSLLFARTMWKDAKAPGVTLMTIPREGGEPEVHGKLVDVASFAVAGPMLWREDGSVLLTTRHPDPANASNAIRLLDTNGTMSTLADGSADGAITDPVLASVASDGTAVSAWSRLDFHEGLWAERTPIFFHLAIASGTATAWNAYPGVDLPDGARLIAPPAFGPDDSVAFLWRVRGGEMRISVLDSSGTFRDISSAGYTPGSASPRNVNGLTPTLQWADDGTLLLILTTGGSVIQPGPDAATPVASPAG